MGGDITHSIQLAVAPVFLLSGIGTILSVLTARLGRVIDRTRVLAALRETTDLKHKKRVDDELQVLTRRRHLVNRAIVAGTVAALLVCVCIAVTFIGQLLDVHVGPIIASLFVVAMLAAISALVMFLMEVVAATTSVDIP